MSEPEKPRATVLPFAVHRPARDPGVLWTPLELLHELAGEIEAARIVPTGLMAFFMVPHGNGQKPCTWSANISYAEAIAFCALEQARTIDDWRTGD